MRAQSIAVRQTNELDGSVAAGVPMDLTQAYYEGSIQQMPPPTREDTDRDLNERAELTGDERNSMRNPTFGIADASHI